MSRAKKPEEKPKEGATLSIDVDSFVRTRDSVVTGLATLQDAIQTLSSAYIKHTNAVLGEHGGDIDVNMSLAKLSENPLLGATISNLQRAASPAAKSVVDAAGSDKKERKKRQHDPNAPKRPLTPFFLYMQTARPIIASDLGANAPKGDVSVEGTKRWASMEDIDKLLWTRAYKDNLRLYNARMHAYKIGLNKNAKDMSAEEALAYAEEHNIGIEQTAEAQLAGEASAGALHDIDAEGEIEPETALDPTVEEEPVAAPPPKATPKAKAARKSKGKATPVSEAIVPPTSSAPKAPEPEKVKEAEKPKTPAKKRKRASKKGEEAVEEPKEPVKEPAAETPKAAPKSRKKKAKTDA